MHVARELKGLEVVYHVCLRFIMQIVTPRGALVELTGLYREIMVLPRCLYTPRIMCSLCHFQRLEEKERHGGKSPLWPSRMRSAGGSLVEVVAVVVRPGSRLKELSEVLNSGTNEVEGAGGRQISHPRPPLLRDMHRSGP